jgi:uncharacterized protein (TIGR02246 family)
MQIGGLDESEADMMALRVAAVITGLGLTLCPAVGAQESGARPAPSRSSTADEARIGEIIAQQVTAWNAGDAKAFSTWFADSGSFTNIRGTVFYGHRAFEDRHAEIFRTFFKGSKLAMSPTRIRFVRPDVAIVDIATEVSRLESNPPGVRPGPDGRLRTRLQQVFVKHGGEWRIESYHNVDIKGP